VVSGDHAHLLESDIGQRTSDIAKKWRERKLLSMQGIGQTIRHCNACLLIENFAMSY